IREKVTDQEIIDHIEQEKESHPVQVLCEVLEVPRSTYYQSFHKVKSSYQIENESILERIKIIHAESKGRYSAPKVHEVLKVEGFNVSLKRVQRLMKAAGIRSIITKKYRPASSASQIEELDNLLRSEERRVVKETMN